jgi:hypothetical protein
MVEAILPLPEGAAELREALAAVLQSGARLPLETTPEGRLILRGPEGQALPLPAETLATLSRVLQLPDSAGGDPAAPRSHLGAPRENVLANLARLVDGAPPGGRVLLDLEAVTVRQQAALELPLPGTENLPDELRTVRLTGRLHLPLAADGEAAPAGPLPADERLPVTVRQAQAGRLLLESPRGPLELRVPVRTSAPEGSRAILTPHEAELSLRGAVTARLPRPVSAGAADAAGAAAASRGELDAAVQALGLLPDAQTRAAVQALMSEGRRVNRATVQAVLAVAARALRAPGSEGYATPDLLRAAAHQLARELPPAPALTRGVAAMMAPRSGFLETLRAVEQSLADLQSAAPAPTGAPPALESALAEARALLEALPVEAASPPAATEGLERFLRGLGGPQLGRLAAALAEAAETLLQEDAPLRFLGRVLDALPAPAPTAAPAPESAALGRVLADLLQGGPAADLSEALAARLPQLTADERAAVEALLRSPPEADPAQRSAELTARLGQENQQRLAQALREVEEALVRENETLARLGTAHEAVRALGERAAAYKAEALAGSRQEPGVFVAEVPVRFQNEDQEAMLKVLYRRRRGPEGAWNRRVLLELATTNLGPVRGDLRFHPARLDVTIGSSREESAGHLESEADRLAAALREKGFQPRLRFPVLALATGEAETGDAPAAQPEAAAPEPPAEPPAGAGPHLDIQI